MFPTALYRCASIEYLNLRRNNLTGELPSEMGPSHLGESLTTLILDDNLFTGAIPPDLSSLTRLQTLSLSNNPFDAGELPASFKNLIGLVCLWADNCSLVGEFPSSVLEMPELKMLALSNNALTGSIPPKLWSLNKLLILDLFLNNFTGDVVVDGNGMAAKILIVI
jgi:Leucine-rich repeat (LRR) protein